MSEKTYKLLSVKETEELILSLKTDFAPQSIEQAKEFIQNRMGLNLNRNDNHTLVGIILDSEGFYYCITECHLRSQFLWVTNDLLDYESGYSENVYWEGLVKDNGLPEHLISEMQNRWIN